MTVPPYVRAARPRSVCLSLLCGPLWIELPNKVESIIGRVSKNDPSRLRPELSISPGALAALVNARALMVACPASPLLVQACQVEVIGILAATPQAY